MEIASRCSRFRRAYGGRCHEYPQSLPLYRPCSRYHHHCRRVWKKLSVESGDVDLRMSGYMHMRVFKHGSLSPSLSPSYSLSPPLCECIQACMRVTCTHAHEYMHARTRIHARTDIQAHGRTHARTHARTGKEYEGDKTVCLQACMCQLSARASNTV